MKKKGWMTIVESFIAILLIVGVLFALINTQKIDPAETSQVVYRTQLSILRNIANDNELRQDILDVPENNLPIRWEDFGSNDLNDVAYRIEEKTPNYLICRAQICNITSICAFESDSHPEGINIYAQSSGITATLEDYKPRQLKLFCWLK